MMHAGHSQLQLLLISSNEAVVHHFHHLHHTGTSAALTCLTASKQMQLLLHASSIKYWHFS
jgi:hypothetical protein